MRNCLSVRALCEFPPARLSQIHVSQVGRRLLPDDRIAQHLSEWAQTAAGIHDQHAARLSAIRLFAAFEPIVAPAGSGQ